uniref:NADH-ubiquinone oxidoreductase chain 6 n=1 Tax=Staphylinidae sp. BMNH 1274665 TaxID=1796589 RepID=A0A126TE92_9COLE|nr:NADH dehydrogenase subunit 6 [Staphylinidae sp. BMNH 1274665]
MKFFIITILLSMIFIFMKHPLTMGFTLLMQTLNITLLTGMLHKNFWFSYILFLIMIGGLLILFIYMTSMAANEIFNYSNKIFFMLLSSLLISIILITFSDNYFIDNLLKFQENIYSLTTNLYLIKYFNFPSIIIIILMINYLLITLLATVKITKLKSGPLRSFS